MVTLISRMGRKTLPTCCDEFQTLAQFSACFALAVAAARPPLPNATLATVCPSSQQRVSLINQQALLAAATNVYSHWLKTD